MSKIEESKKRSKAREVQRLRNHIKQIVVARHKTGIRHAELNLFLDQFADLFWASSFGKISIDSDAILLCYHLNRFLERTKTPTSGFGSRPSEREMARNLKSLLSARQLVSSVKDFSITYRAGLGVRTKFEHVFNEKLLNDPANLTFNLSSIECYLEKLAGTLGALKASVFRKGNKKDIEVQFKIKLFAEFFQQYSAAMRRLKICPINPKAQFRSVGRNGYAKMNVSRLISNALYSIGITINEQTINRYINAI